MVDAAVGDEQLGADVLDRDVVRRVVRLLPDVERTGGVRDHVAAEVRPHALGTRLYTNSSTHALDYTVQ
jgi:hypothetical protein